MYKIFVLFAVIVYCEAGGNYGSPIPAAITSTRTVELRPVVLPQDPILPQIVEVAPLELPIQIIYNSRSSPVFVQQNHIPGVPGQVEQTSSKEEPHVVIHEVERPVIQELREIITPYRRVVQEVAPVVETVNTIVAKGEQPVAVPQVAPVTSLGPAVPVLPVAEKVVVPSVASLSKPYLLPSYKGAASSSS